MGSDKRLLALPLTLMAKAARSLQRALTAAGKECPNGAAGGRRIGKVKPLKSRLVGLQHPLRLRVYEKRNLGGMLEKYSVTRGRLTPIPVVPLERILGIEQLLLELSSGRKATSKEEPWREAGLPPGRLRGGLLFSLRVAELAQRVAGAPARAAASSCSALVKNPW